VWIVLCAVVLAGTAGCQTRRPASGGRVAVERTWQPIDDSPLSRRPGRTAVWTGAEMLIWGGAFLCANDRCDEEIAQPASGAAGSVRHSLVTGL